MEAEFLELAAVDGALHVRLNRPDALNALNRKLVSELTSVFLALPEMPEVRVVVLSGNGPSFCAGADVAMMRRAAGLTLKENRQEALEFAGLFHALDSCPQPLVARVHGAVLGGGMGLIACCDVVMAERATIFAFTEVRLGILPAVISPFAISKIGASAARAHFVLGDRFDTAEALRIGLIHEVRDGEADLDAAVSASIASARLAAPGAAAAAKQLVRDLNVSGVTTSEAVLERTVELMATRRASDEGREGLEAFLEKRKPRWAASD